MNKMTLAAPFLLAMALQSGCGGPASTTAAGRAVITVVWPSRSRLIPAASNSIQVAFARGGQPIASQVLTRPATGNQTTAAFNNLKVGDLSLTATAFPNPDATGVAQATGSTPVTITNGQTTNVTLTMDSTIASVAISPPSPSVAAGSTLPLSVTARDANSNIVLVSPAKLTWTSKNSAIATVNGAGIVTGVAQGSTSITVTDTESGKSGTVTLSVVTASVGQKSVAYQIDAAHTGVAVFGQPLTFPSAPTWSVDLGGPASYPLIAGGRAYVVTTSGSLYCLDLKTGAQVWGPVGNGFRAEAYDQGRVFLLSLGGTLQEVDAVTGQLGWSMQLPGQYSFSATPTAVGGTVYAAGAGSGGTAYAVNEVTGSLLWQTSVINGDQSAPAVTSDGVYLSYPCQDYKLAPATGATVWHYSNGCDGGGGKTMTVANGRVYDRENGGIIFSAATGNQVGSFASNRIPALNDKVACFLAGNTLSCTDASTQQVLWTFSGDGQLVSAPLIIDTTVIVGSATGLVYAIDATSGQQVWSGSAGAAIPTPDEQNLTTPLTGFGAGEGYLVVSAGSRLTAWHLAGP